jgi:hypothetical protein
MAYTLPTFNLRVNVYRWNGSGYTYFATYDCNLAMGRRTSQYSSAMEPGDQGGLTPSLLLPPLTDIQDNSTGSHADVAECPAGTRRWYNVSCVDDIGKGFPNEHRIATLAKGGWFGDWITFGFTPWPSPIP